jgi:hypothetical protein
MTTTSNGQHAPTDADATGEPPGPSARPGAPALASLREHPVNVHLLRGYGPLVVGIILFVLMVTLAPTVAPEHVVERPIDPTTETTAP